MNTLRNYDKLLKYMYDEFNRGNNASGYGEHIQVLIGHFENSSRGNRIGDANDQVGAVKYFLDNGFINALDTLGNRIISPREAYTYGRMQPTEKGKNYLQQKRIGAANTIASVLGTFFGRLIKSILGK